jgi:predicted Zn-dependent protease with MMP-like domain
MDREPFEKLVEEAMASLPKKFREFYQANNVALIVQDYAPLTTRRQFGAVDKNDILGLYSGIPLTKRGASYGNVPPDVIFLYQKAIESRCRTDEEIRAQVQETVVHEVGHFFGLDDARIYENVAEVRAARRRAPKKESEP